MSKEIIVTFDGDAVTIETKGYAGAECEAATADVERALGVRTANVRTPEFHRAASTTARAEARRG